MAITYIVPGYGIARNAKQFEEVDKYIATVRNVINRDSNLNSDKPVVVLSGGPTASTEPYEETEAGSLQSAWLQQDPSTNADFMMEIEAICSLENIILARKLLEPFGLAAEIKVFVENIRLQRMQVICDHLLKDCTVQVVPIDLGHQADTAAQEGERIGIIWIQWALAKPDNFVWYRSLFAEKIIAARQAYERAETFDAVNWWKTKWVLIKERLALDGYLV